MEVQELNITQSIRSTLKEQMAAGWIETQLGQLTKFKEIFCSIAFSGTQNKKTNMFGSILTQSSQKGNKVLEFTSHMLVWHKKQGKFLHIENTPITFYQLFIKQVTT